MPRWLVSSYSLLTPLVSRNFGRSRMWTLYLGGVNCKPAVSRRALREGQPTAAVDAVGEVQRRAEVAGPERVAAAPVGRAALLHLVHGVHREQAGTREPALVSRPVEQRQEGIAVPGRPVAEVRALPQRAGAPYQAAARDRELLVHQFSERRHDSRRAVAPLRADLAVPMRVETLPMRVRQPVGEAGLLHDEALERLRDAVGRVAERERAAREPVRRPEAAVAVPVQLLRPEAVGVTLPLQPLDARRDVEPELATREHRARASPHEIAPPVPLLGR